MYEGVLEAATAPEPLPQRQGRRKRNRVAASAGAADAASGGAASPAKRSGSGGDSSTGRPAAFYVGDGSLDSAGGAITHHFSRNVTEAKYEYLDHTADIQLHAWGETMAECFEQIAIAMFGYMTELSSVEIDDSVSDRIIECEGRDAQTLLFHWLDECLAVFTTEDFVVKDVKMLAFPDRLVHRAGGDAGADADMAGARATASASAAGGAGSGAGAGAAAGAGGADATGAAEPDGGSDATPLLRIRAAVKGETYSEAKHPKGTEVKAITYSNMQVRDTPDDKGLVHLYCIVDI